MKKTFIIFVIAFMISCSGEIYEDQIIIKEDGLAYNKESDSLFSGDVLDKYGELLGVYKRGLKDGEWFEVDIRKGTQKKAKYIKGIPDGEQVTYLFPGPREKNKRLEYIKYEDGKIVGTWTTWSKDSEGRLITRGEITFEDGAATLTDLSGRIIGAGLFSLLSDVRNKLFKVLVSGGGRKNKTLIQRIKSRTLKNLVIQSIDDYGIDGDYVESQAFAFLAIRRFLELPISFPDTTGCKSPTIGGEIVKNF